MERSARPYAVSTAAGPPLYVSARRCIDRFVLDPSTQPRSRKRPLLRDENSTDGYRQAQTRGRHGSALSERHQDSRCSLEAPAAGNLWMYRPGSFCRYARSGSKREVVCLSDPRKGKFHNCSLLTARRSMSPNLRKLTSYKSRKSRKSRKSWSVEVLT